MFTTVGAHGLSVIGCTICDNSQENKHSAAGQSGAYYGSSEFVKLPDFTRIDSQLASYTHCCFIVGAHVSTRTSEEE